MYTDSVTLWNDDPMSVKQGMTNGLFHYPAHIVDGWSRPAHTHYTRPWHVWNIGYLVYFPFSTLYAYHSVTQIDFCRHLVSTDNPHCLNNRSYFDEQLQITGQFLRVYSNDYHFSFTFATESTHDDPSMFAAHDRTLQSFIEQLYIGGYLNRTALVMDILQIHISRTGTHERSRKSFVLWDEDTDWTARREETTFRYLLVT